MPNVVFVAPYLAETTLRFVSAVALLPGVRAAIVTQESSDKLPPNLQEHLAAHLRVDDSLDPVQIAQAVEALSGQMGPVHRIVGALEQLQVPLGQVRDAFGIPGMGAEAARNFRDKSRMKTILRAAGIGCARHALASSAGDAQESARAIGFPLVAKPPAGAGAKATHRVESDDELARYLAAHPPSADHPLLLEEFLHGTEHSLETVSIAGRPVWHSLTRYFPTPLEVVENPWIQWCVVLPREVDHPRYDDIRAVAAKALATLGMGTGLTHMEWFRRADGSVAISEVGARPPGAQFTTLISYAHDIDMYAAWARLMVYEEFDPPERKFAAGVAFLRGQGEGSVKAIRGVGQAQKEIGGIVVEARLPRRGQPRSGTYEGEGFVLVRHPETKVVERALERLVSLIRVEMG